MKNATVGSVDTVKLVREVKDLQNLVCDNSETLSDLMDAWDSLEKRIEALEQRQSPDFYNKTQGVVNE